MSSDGVLHFVHEVRHDEETMLVADRWLEGRRLKIEKAWT